MAQTDEDFVLNPFVMLEVWFALNSDLGFNFTRLVVTKKMASRLQEHDNWLASDSRSWSVVCCRAKDVAWSSALGIFICR